MEPSPHLRGVAILITAATVGFFIWMMVVSTSAEQGLVVLAFLAVILVGWNRFSKETSIVRRYIRTWGKVIDYDDQSNSDGPYFKISYRFESPDGLPYRGSIGSGRELPKIGQAIEILFRREDPTINMPRDVFWFYAW